MATSVTTGPSPVSSVRESARQSSLSAIIAAEWPIYAVVFASTCILIGLIWDISWHRTIGRDTFWSPPHLLEQIAAIVAGISCGYVALRTTFSGTPDARARSVRYWRWFQAPLGAWVCIWGTLMMITSAPFDNWWHNAYGLDVKIISPPHMVLAAGMIGIELGAVLMALGAQNRATSESERKRLGLLLAYASAVIIGMTAVVIMEDAAFANEMHGSKFYKYTGAVITLNLVAFARISGLKWPATTIAALYMVLVLIPMWILQLVPAQPLLAPIYNPVTHMVPPPFPLLLVFPAVAIDLLMRRLGPGRDWLLSLAIGVAFVGVMFAVHWYWADFLLSPAARNILFASDQWDYSFRLGPWRYIYWNLDTDAAGHLSRAALAGGLALAALYAAVSARIGLWIGSALQRIKR